MVYSRKVMEKEWIEVYELRYGAEFQEL